VVLAPSFDDAGEGTELEEGCVWDDGKVHFEGCVVERRKVLVVRK
jgi:hypothetical protein